jgi:hypothetical protein
MKRQSSVPLGPRTQFSSRSIHNEIAAKLKNRLRAKAQADALTKAETEKNEAYAAAIMAAWANAPQQPQPHQRPRLQQPQARSHHRFVSGPFAYVND